MLTDASGDPVIADTKLDRLVIPSIEAIRVQKLPTPLRSILRAEIV
jgi:hypothetical protein